MTDKQKLEMRSTLANIAARDVNLKLNYADHIIEMTEREMDMVIILAPNPEPTSNDENYAVDVSGDWTQNVETRYYGKTRYEALENAYTDWQQGFVTPPKKECTGCNDDGHCAVCNGQGECTVCKSTGICAVCGLHEIIAADDPLDPGLAQTFETLGPPLVRMPEVITNVSPCGPECEPNGRCLYCTRCKAHPCEACAFGPIT